MTRILLIALTIATIVLVALAWIHRDDPLNPDKNTGTSQSVDDIAKPSSQDGDSVGDTTQLPIDSTKPTTEPRPYVPYITPKSERSKAVVEAMSPVIHGELDKKGFRLGDPVYIRIFKENKTLEVWLKKKGKFALFKTYPIATFSGTLGPKFQEGDKQSPEGFYFVTPRMLNPNSKFHLAFNIGYPNKYDQDLGRTGSAIMVHGKQQSIGCYAMTDPVMEEIYTLVDAALSTGQKFFRVHIFPFHMTDDNLKHHIDSPNIDFWKNLKQGYDAFERTHTPPNVTTKNHRYRFN
jgi:murein L,D-transpeptidase YafK